MNRESWRTRLWRWTFNWFPAYRGTGGRITFIAGDWSEIRIRLPLSWRTRNYVGSIFGGSMYGAIDPVYMLMLIKGLGRDYEVWDKSATIRFRRPGRETLRATFRVSAEDLAQIRAGVAAQGRIDKEFVVDLVNAEGVRFATCQKLVHVRQRGLAAAPTTATEA